MWLLLDKQDLEQDRRLAQHILGVHQGIVQKVRADELKRLYKLTSLDRRRQSRKKLF